MLFLQVAIIWLLDALHLALYLVTSKPRPARSRRDTYRCPLAVFIYLVQKKGAFFGQQPLPW